jgi:hypothetical protein
VSQQEHRLQAGLPSKKSDQETLENLKEKLRNLDAELALSIISERELNEVFMAPKPFNYLLDLPETY